MYNFLLNNGLEIPVIGFGTYKASQESIRLAIQAGYRYFDTAEFYGNEEILGNAIKESNIPRNEFFIASKLWKTNLGYINTMNAFNMSLKRLNVDYIDAYFIHWPRPDLINEYWRELDNISWRAMEDLYNEGKIKILGLSNFLPNHAENIINDCRIMPSIAQLEFHPGYTQTFALNYYQKKNIQVQAWSPTARGRVLDDELIVELAEKYNVNPVQICLRFCIQEKVSVIVKSSEINRMRQNLEVLDFVIDSEDMMRLENMPVKGWSGEHPDRERIKI